MGIKGKFKAAVVAAFACCPATSADCASTSGPESASAARSSVCDIFPSCYDHEECFCTPKRCVPDQEYECVPTHYGYTTYMFGLNYGSGDARGFEVGVLPPFMPPRAAGGYSGFVLGVGDLKRRRVYLEYTPSFIVYLMSWYWGAGIGYEPERGPMMQATIGAGAFILLPYVRVMVFPVSHRATGEVGVSLKFGAIGDTRTMSYQERRKR